MHFARNPIIFASELQGTESNNVFGIFCRQLTENSQNYVK